MNLLQLRRGSKQYGLKTLFDGASFAVNAGEHVGVIGPNGAGKSTLFKILVGHESLDEGDLTKAQALRLGYLEQEADWSLEQTAEEYLTESCVKPIWELKQLGRKLGLGENHLASRLTDLSGGYRMRVKLLYLIGQEPNLMLLDEPTNFLDLESVLALETFLREYTGAFLLISHDREFLKRTTEYTLEVEGGDITKFPGHIDDYFEQKAQLREILAAQAAGVESKRQSIQDFVTRFGAKATKAKQAQSRLKQLDRLEKVEIKDLPVRARIKIPEPTHVGREVLTVRGADLGYGDRAVLRDVNLILERGAHLGVVGHNGAGKSTLLKSLAGVNPLLNGERALGYQVSLSIFSQHSADQLSPDDTVLTSLQSAAHKDVGAQDVLNMAGSLLFPGDDVQKRVRVLSGGEKSRVALGQILLKRSPLLLLDEPTNHLDFDTVEALTEALRAYAGTVIVVSHDRGFIGRIATRILEIRDGRVEVYPGTYDEYVWSVERGALSDRAVADDAPAPRPKNASASPAPRGKDQTKRRQAELKNLKREIAKIEATLRTLEASRDRLTTDLINARGEVAAVLARDLNVHGRDLTELEDTLLARLEAVGANRKRTARKFELIGGLAA